MKKNEKISSTDHALFLVSGSDEFEVSRRARLLVDRLCPEADRALGLDVVDGACDTVDESIAAIRRVLDGLRTVGFFGSAKLIWLRDASFLYDSRPGKSAEVKAALAGLTAEIKQGLLPGVRFLVSAPQVDKRTAFYKAMDAAGSVELFDLPEKSYKWDEHARDVLRTLFEEAGLRAGHDVITLMVGRAGPFSRQLHAEVEKLSLYLGDRKQVTTDDVLAIVSPAREHGYGELADAFGKKSLPEALRVARLLLEQKETAVGLMIGLQQRVHDLLIYSIALSRRWAFVSGSPDWPKLEWSASPEAESFFSSLASDPRRVNPYWGGILARQAARFTVEELQRAQRELVESHGMITDGSAPAEFMLEWALIKTLGRAA